MKIVNRRTKVAYPKTVEDVRIGIVFTASMGEPESPTDLYLKAYEVAVDLDNPSNTWDLRTSVYNYKRVDAYIVIEGEDNEDRG